MQVRTRTTHPYALIPRGRVCDPTIRFQSKVKTLARRSLHCLLVGALVYLRGNLREIFEVSWSLSTTRHRDSRMYIINVLHDDIRRFTISLQDYSASRRVWHLLYFDARHTTTRRHMSYDCCGDSRTAGDSFHAGLRNALSFVQEDLLNDSRYHSWILLSVIAVISLLLLRRWVIRS